jgi:hypothetical protein
MSKEKKCLYTSMLTQLSALDEQIHQMQANLAQVREFVNAKFDSDRLEDAAQSENKRAATETKGDK